MDLVTASHGEYSWLVTEHDLREFLQLCPSVLLGRYVAVTGNDGTSMTLTQDEIAAGWTQVGGIAYSPMLRRIDGLPHPGDNFDEFYVFRSPTQLGERHTDNVFETGIVPGRVRVFVNYFDFLLYEEPDLANLFWKQMGLIQPESYLGDTQQHLTFVTRNLELFSFVKQTLIANPV